MGSHMFHTPHLVDRTVGAVKRWPVESQQRARRNAMIASTALAQRRAELDDVEEFLAALGGAPVPEVAAHAAHG
ncbi:uncharacterized protein PD653_0063 [Nocardioides sp. PD653]|nr:uncharacterized protein PD653B2_3665 [Nocardioides sp. PD653-B2]GAW52670.1 uncharacterized protein PD653_0063 [Nocardioides sp. PD653]